MLLWADQLTVGVCSVASIFGHKLVMLSVVCVLIVVAVAVLVFLLLVMGVIILLLLLWWWWWWCWWCWSAQSLSAAQIAARQLPRWRQEFQQLLRAPLRSTIGQVSGTSVLDILVLAHMQARKSSGK